MHKVLSTGSSGNAVLYVGCILVDCGVPYSLLKPYVRSIQLVLLTHWHLDHYNITTIKKLAFERPTLRFGCCEWMVDKLEGIKNIDVYEIGKLYNYGSFSISPVKAYHDVPNCGYRIIKDDYKIIHITDTCTLEGISAKGYSLFAIEANYDSDTIQERIAAKEARGQFTYEKGAMNSHLSAQQANDWIFNNKGENYEILRLHESRNNA